MPALSLDDMTASAPSVVRHTHHKAPLCVCWNYFESHLSLAICELASIDLKKFSMRWEYLTPDEQDRVEAVIHTMAEAREERAA